MNENEEKTNNVGDRKKDISQIGYSLNIYNMTENQFIPQISVKIISITCSFCACLGTSNETKDFISEQ